MTDREGRRVAVVAAASRHGSTAEIAMRIAHTLRERLSPQWTAKVVDVSDLQSLESADAVVLGSAVYVGRWLGPAVTALHTVKDAPLLDLWLFSTGPVSDDVRDNARIITADEAVEAGSAVEHKVFAGRLDLARLSWWERLVVRVVGVVPGDRRDWAAVDDWAAGIAAKLTEATATTEPPHDAG